MSASEESADSVNNQPRGSRRILVLFMIGSFIILLGLIILTIAAIISSGGSTGYGIIIFIGPIPIVLGAGPGAPWLILFAIMLAALSIIVFFLMRRRIVKMNV